MERYVMDFKVYDFVQLKRQVISIEIRLYLTSFSNKADPKIVSKYIMNYNE